MQKGEWRTFTVERTGQTDKGTRTLKAVGNPENLLVSKDVLALPNAGQAIEGLITESTYGGKVYHWLSEWRRSEAAPEASQAPTDVPGVTRPTPDAEMRFISNVVGQAILAKTITEPEQIIIWAVAAQVAMQRLGAP